MSEYTQGFRPAMVRRLTGPGAISANALQAETGVPQSTLSRWLRQASSVDDVSKRSTKKARRLRKIGKIMHFFPLTLGLRLVSKNKATNTQPVKEICCAVRGNRGFVFATMRRVS